MDSSNEIGSRVQNLLREVDVMSEKAETLSQTSVTGDCLENIFTSQSQGPSLRNEVIWNPNSRYKRKMI